MLDKFFDFFHKRRWVGTTLKWVLFALFAFGLFFTYLWQDTAVNYTDFGISAAFGGNDTLNDLMVIVWWFICPAALICIFRLLGYRGIKTMRWLNAIFAFPVAILSVSTLPKLVQYMTGGGTVTEVILGRAVDTELRLNPLDARWAVIGLFVLVITLLIVSTVELVYSFLYAESADVNNKKFVDRVWAVTKENYALGGGGGV